MMNKVTAAQKGGCFSYRTGAAGANPSPEGKVARPSEARKKRGVCARRRHASEQPPEGRLLASR